LDKADGILHGADIARVRPVDLHCELVFESDHQLGDIEAIRAKVLAEGGIGLDHLFGNPQLRLVYLIGTVYGFAQATISFLPALAMAAFGASGMTSAQSSFLLLPMVVAMAIGSPLVGRLLDKVGSRLIITAGLVSGTAAFLILGLLSSSMVGYIGGEVLLGIAIAALAGAPLRYIVLAETPSKDRTVAQGLTSIFITVGGVIGSALIGSRAASTASPLAGWSSAFLLVALPCLVALVVAFFLKGKISEREAAKRNQAG
jgi:MFS family permease